MASSTFIIAQESAIMAARSAVEAAISAVLQERKAERCIDAKEDGKCYSENRGAWGTLHANASALMTDLFRLTAMLERDFRFDNTLQTTRTIMRKGECYILDWQYSQGCFDYSQTNDPLKACHLTAANLTTWQDRFAKDGWVPYTINVLTQMSPS